VFRAISKLFTLLFFLRARLFSILISSLSEKATLSFCFDFLHYENGEKIFFAFIAKRKNFIFFFCNFCHSKLPWVFLKVACLRALGQLMVQNL
jgi:hypothetical protein